MRWSSIYVVSQIAELADLRLRGGTAKDVSTPWRPRLLPGAAAAMRVRPLFKPQRANADDEFSDHIGRQSVI